MPWPSGRVFARGDSRPLERRLLPLLRALRAEPVPAGISCPPSSATRPRWTIRRVDRLFGAVLFDWDGTAVVDRRADASELRELVERLCGLGVLLVVASGTHLENVDGQLRRTPGRPGRLW